MFGMTEEVTYRHTKIPADKPSKMSFERSNQINSLEIDEKEEKKNSVISVFI